MDQLSVLARFLIEQGASLRDVGLLLLYRLPGSFTSPCRWGGVRRADHGRPYGQDSELKAAYSLGVPPRALLTPFVILGLAVGALTLLNNGYLEPRGEAAYQKRIDAFIYTRPPAALQLNAAYQIGGNIYLLRVRVVENDPRSPTSRACSSS